MTGFNEMTHTWRIDAFVAVAIESIVANAHSLTTAVRRVEAVGVRITRTAVHVELALLAIALEGRTASTLVVAN
jgi:hypothetical protein